MPRDRRLLVVSHAGVVASNQLVYAALATLGWDVRLVVPRSWRTEYSGHLEPQVAHGLEDRVTHLGVVGRGRPQRHAYVARATRLVRQLRPDVVLVEEEPFSLAARQWAWAAQHASTPFGVQLAETLDRALPSFARRSRAVVLERASFVVARSPSARRLAQVWGARGVVGVVPHSVQPVDPRPLPGGRPTVAFVGRLVAAKGVVELLDAVRRLDGRVDLVVAGEGPLRAAVEAAGEHVTLLGPVPHERIGEVYARAHVTCVPSRTTPTWVEQFGRVAVESLLRGVPVVAFSSGELPWVLGQTGGGVLVDEGDVVALAAAIESLTSDPVAAAALGQAGRTGVLRQFTDDAAAAALDRLLSRVRSG